MKFRVLLPLCVGLASLALRNSAFAFEISHGVDGTANPFSKPDGSPLAAGEYTLRLGYFNFAADYAANNAAIASNAGDVAALNAAFVPYFNFNPNQQTQGDQGTLGDVNGEAGPNGGLTAGNNYAYLAQDNTAYASGFAGRNMYAWYTLTSDPSVQLIAAEDSTRFQPGNDPFATAAGLTISEQAATLDIIVGRDRTGSASNDYQLTIAQSPANLLNISTRLRVLDGENVLIGGFIITGTASKRVIIRAIGPTISGISDSLQNPFLELFQGETSLASNNDWKETQRAEIEATGVPPQDDRESAIVRTLAPGEYTAIVSGVSGTVGVGLVEVFDLDQTVDSRLANISTRGFVDRGENVMIGGLIVGGGGGGSTSVLVRAIGPSIQGVTNKLQDPTLELVNRDGVTIGSNNDWRESQEAAIQSTGVAPNDNRESAILTTVAPGAYTAIVRGRDDTTGVALVEVFNLR